MNMQVKKRSEVLLNELSVSYCTLKVAEGHVAETRGAMRAMNIDNCPRCGKLYAVNIRELCPNCMQDIEKAYEVCVQYLRDNKGANIQELSEATEVSIRQITKFIREGRISIANAPNMMYPCEVCGTLIREGHMCDYCRVRLRKELEGSSHSANGQNQGDNIGLSTYSAIDKRRNF